MSKFLIKYLCPKTNQWREFEETAEDWLDDKGQVFQSARQVIEDWGIVILERAIAKAKELGK